MLPQFCMDANNVVNNVQYPAKTDRFASQAAKNVTRSHGDYFCIGYICFLTSQSDASFALHYMNHRWVFLQNIFFIALLKIKGSRRWLQWRKEIELLSDLTYYLLTTLSGYQTLGEEYVNIIQVDPSKRRIPSRTRRTALIFFHTFVPYLLDKVFICIENELETERREQINRTCWKPMSHLRFWIQRAVIMLTDNQKKSLLPLVFGLQQGITLSYRLHVALFYITGTYYHISKRAAGVSYLSVRSLAEDDSRIRNSYRLLGALSLLQLAITLTLQLNNLRQRQRARQEWKQHRNLIPSHQVGGSVSRSSRCILCLEERRHSTSTPCGHLFCWECITKWCNTKTECPLCREKFQPHRLVYLRNYS